MAKKSKWEYRVQIKNDMRLYRDPKSSTGHKEKLGLSWSLCRSADDHWEDIITSPEVFDEEGDAINDAIKTLSFLRCSIDCPLDNALDFVFNNNVHH